MTEDRWEIFGDYDDDRKFNEGVKHERERIIALLKLPGCHEWQENGEHYESKCVTCYNVALIKGESQ